MRNLNVKNHFLFKNISLIGLNFLSTELKSVKKQRSVLSYHDPNMQCFSDILMLALITCTRNDSLKQEKK